MKRWNRKAHPLLAGTKIAHQRIAVWCPFCRKYHIHGHDPEEDRDDDATHRCAHCHTADSPFNDTGYYVTVAPKLPS